SKFIKRHRPSSLFPYTTLFRSTDLGGSDLVAVGTLDTDVDIALAHFDPAGKHRWSARFGGAGQDFCSGIAVDGSGGTIVTGSHLDRKSTRLNSSHDQISYAVFC